MYYQVEMGQIFFLDDIPLIWAIRLIMIVEIKDF